ncbi:hypothetical protein NQZ68_030119 [Dissostichus eleginoides]|nr:hypothetical protein NQZ68_030119 [Dissostichus eleginoides]
MVETCAQVSLAAKLLTPGQRITEQPIVSIVAYRAVNYAASNSRRHPSRLKSYVTSASEEKPVFPWSPGEACVPLVSRRKLYITKFS